MNENEYEQSLVKFGWLAYDEMLQAIRDHLLKAYDVCFTKDTKEIYILSSTLSPIPIKSRMRVFGSIEVANANINTTAQTYEGELVSIFVNEKFVAYIVNKKQDGTYYVAPVDNDRQISYDELVNAPITNLNGTVEEPVVLSSLANGFYKVVGRFVTPDNHTIVSYVGDYVIVEDSQIKRISATEIIDYVISNNTVTKSEYTTKEYVLAQNYATETYVTDQISAMQAYLEEYIREYVTTTLTALVKYIVTQEIDSRYTPDSEIYKLFN